MRMSNVLLKPKTLASSVHSALTMAETDAHTRLADPNPTSQDQVSKRKAESDDPRETTKIPRYDQNQSPSENGEDEKVTLDKGKGKSIVLQQDEETETETYQKSNPSSTPPKVLMDKGKGKMIEQEVEEESEDDSDDDAFLENGSDSDYSDDPLMEVDMNNILPSRTRRFALPVPGAYLVPDQDEEEDDDEDVHVDDDDIDDDDDDDDEDA